MDSSKYEQVYATGLGVVVAALSNYLTKRPINSRLPVYALYGAVGFGIGTVLKQFNEKRIAERELAIWDYVQRHPEDFPELHPKKYKEVLLPWSPIR